MMGSPASIVAHIRTLYQARGYRSDRQFAQAAGIPTNCLGLWAKQAQGRCSITLLTACKMAETLGVSLDTLMGREPDTCRIHGK